MGIFSASLLGRYRTYFYDQLLRAEGQVRSSIAFGGFKLAYYLMGFSFASAALELWGAVFGLALEPLFPVSSTAMWRSGV